MDEFKRSIFMSFTVAISSFIPKILRKLRKRLKSTGIVNQIDKSPYMPEKKSGKNNE